MRAPASSYPSLRPIGLIWRSVVFGLIYLLVSTVTASFGALLGVMQTISSGGFQGVG